MFWLIIYFACIFVFGYCVFEYTASIFVWFVSIDRNPSSKVYSKNLFILLHVFTAINLIRLIWCVWSANFLAHFHMCLHWSKPLIKGLFTIFFSNYVFTSFSPFPSTNLLACLPFDFVDSALHLLVNIWFCWE